MIKTIFFQLIKLKMDTLRKNSEITNKYMVLLEQLNASFVVQKKKINEEILKQSTEKLKEKESSEFPLDFYEEITRLKIEYDTICSKEKEEEEKLMTKYNSMFILPNVIESVNEILKIQQKKCLEVIDDDDFTGDLESFKTLFERLFTFDESFKTLFERIFTFCD